jgi:reactive intermediate/imine deaminase
MSFKRVHSDQAPAAIGPYSQAIRAGDTVYLAGQIGLDPKTMTIVEGGVEAQCRRVLDNLRSVARASGGDLDRIVKLNVYVTDMSTFPAVNAVMDEYLREPYPARATVGVAALPRGAVVEMDAVMVL